MSQQNPGESGPEPAPFAEESAVVRARLADLGGEAEELRGRARELLRSAAARHTIVEIDRRVHGDTGRHALEPAVEFDPTPYDPSEDSDHDSETELLEIQAAPASAVADGPEAAFGAFGAEPASPTDDPWAPRAGGSMSESDTDGLFGAAPAFDPVSHDARIPAVPVEPGRQPLASAEPGAVLGVETDEPRVDESRVEAEGATIIEFAPRPSSEVLPDDVEQAFGAPEPPEPPEPAEPDTATEFAPAPDEIAGIASSESTVLPPDWDGAGADDEEDAFAKFFSAEVEPEPAQRWLLNE